MWQQMFYSPTVREEAQSHPGWLPWAGDRPGPAPLGSLKEIPRADLHLFLPQKLSLSRFHETLLPALVQLESWVGTTGLWGRRRRCPPGPGRGAARL